MSIKSGETGNKEMGLELESIKIGNGGQDGGYRMRKKRFGRTYINILHDPRVVRGNTYAAFVIPSSLQMEFMRLKEEEERRKRMMKVPKRLPRVALMGSKKSKEDEYFDESEYQEQPDSPQFKILEDPEKIDDIQYFFEDRPPTPKFIPMPPGVEVATQIEDGELFDFDLEVEPILQVLVGRSLVQATYELIGEEERAEYLQHKKQYEQEREFELINLQRMEAMRQRREDEKKRRQMQVNQKKLYDIEIQKKLISKISAKTYLRKLNKNVLNRLFEVGYLKDNQNLKLADIIHKLYIPQSEFSFIQGNKIIEIFNQIENNQENHLSNAHKVVMDKERERVRKIIENKEISIRIAEENELKRIKEKSERTENRRIDRITKSITENVIQTKNRKNDLMNIPLCDIDELKFKNENIHSLGGQLGLTIITLDSILRQLAESNTITNENLNMPEVMQKFIEELLLVQLKDYQQFEMRYLSTQKLDFSQPPESEEKRKEFEDFLIDYRRVVNKSLKLLIEKEFVSDYVFKIFIETLAKIYLFSTVDVSLIEIDPENQEPEYLESIKKKQEDLTRTNIKMEKMKRKIKLNFIKPEDLKMKRENIGGFIIVKPNKEIIDSFIEEDQIPIEIEQKENLEENVKDSVKEKVDETIDDMNNQDPIQDLNNIVKIPQTEPNLIEVPKFEIVTTKIDYLNEAEVFRNSSVPIDTYILHLELSEWFISLTVRSFRRILKSNYKIQIDLLNTIQQVKDKVNSHSQWMIEHIMTNEKYLNKTLIPFNVEPIPLVKEVEDTEGNTENLI